LMRRRAPKAHLLGKKSPKRRRSFGKDDVVAHSDVKTVKKMLGKG
jgi:large subunit ribosomal protein L35